MTAVPTSIDFSLDDVEMQRMASLANGERLGPDPRTCNAQ
jgi:hypothetical protein